MSPTTDGTYRAFADPRDADRALLVPLDGEGDYDPTAVRLDGYEGDLADAVAALHPGNRVRATLEWEAGTARFAALVRETETLVEFVDGVTGLFEAARETWREARAEGLGVNGDVTYSTDGEPVGAVYTFAEQAGVRDVFAEFRDCSRPLEPLIERLDAAEPHEVFVMRPADEEFVLVYLVIERDSLLADTVRDTYDCPRPASSD
jgi:hypothetical protein